MQPEKNLDVEVFNLGIPGATSEVIRIKELGVAISLAPSWAVILAGTNDMINSSCLKTLTEFEENLVFIISALECAHISVVAISPPPCIEDLLYTRHKVEAYGSKVPLMRLRECSLLVKRISEMHGCLFLDLFSLFSENPAQYIRTMQNSGENDGVHLTAEGYETVGRMVAGIICRNGYSGGKVACLGDSLTYGFPLPEGGTITGRTYPGVLQRQLADFMCKTG